MKKQSMKKSGFTLVELMVVIAIAAILVALAVPNYQQGILKGRRSDAQQDLLEFAGNAERVFTQTNDYRNTALPVNTDFYTYTTPVLTESAYEIRATPKTVQNDDKCLDMSLSNTGARKHLTEDPEDPEESIWVSGWCD